MTIAAAWVRTLANGAEELIFCSDSRLSGGNRFDHGQKTFRFARTDAAICFAGHTYWAYPMVVAAVKAADLHVPSQTRALSLSKFKNHLVNILNQMQREVHNYAGRENIPDVTFIFGGYDWWDKSFRIWRIQFDEDEGKFVAAEQQGSNRFGGLGKVEIAGDDEWVKEMRRRLKELAQSRYGMDMKTPLNARFDLEPFEVIKDLLLDANAASTIGGAPQAVKIYQYLNSADVGIFWPNAREGRLFLSGRPLLDYENATIKSILDAESLVSTWASGNPAEASASVARATDTAEARQTDQDTHEEALVD